jgi:predicted permease
MPLFHHHRSSEMDEELRSHIAHRADDLERTGLPRKEAERRARIEFGGYTHFKEESQAPASRFLEILSQDTRFALRMLRKSPGFTLTAILTLALAIGANAVVFSLLNTFVLQPIDLPGGKNLYQIGWGKERYPSHSYPDYRDMRDRNHSFDGLITYEISTAGLDSGGAPTPTWIYTTSGNYFDVLGVQPYLGRFFHPSDEHGPDSAPYLVLSYAYWQQHFQGDRAIAGRVVRINKFPYTILGVAPPKFRGTELFFAPDLWAPIVNQQQIEGSSDLEQRGNRGRWVVGRLKPGVTPAQATADLNSIAAWLAKTYPADDDNASYSLARPGLLGDLLGGPVHAFIAGLTLLATLILIAACANLGSLFSARAADRSREVALRLALGSSRSRILRQLLTEAVLVSLAGGALGLLGSIVLLRALSAWRPVPDLPIDIAVSPSTLTYVFALLLAVLSGLIFGLVPMRQILKADPYQGIKAGAANAAGSRRVTVRDVLLACQIAVCAVLVTSSLVAVRGMVRSLKSNFGFDPHNAILMNTDLNMAGYKDNQIAVMQKRMIEAAQSIPGVTAAAYADRFPLYLSSSDSAFYRDSTTDYRSSNAGGYALEYKVSPGYFQAASTRLVLGRAFTANDIKDAPFVAVINQELARKLFGSEQQAVGSFFKVWGGTRTRVVGVVEDGKYTTLTEDPKPAMFFPILQSPSSQTWLILRTSRSPQEITSALEHSMHGLDSGLPITIHTWQQELATALFAARAASITLGVLGALGAMLAITGIFGTAAYSVSKRLRELGIRIALGAQRKEVLTAALGRVFRLLTIGSITGLLLGVAATKLLSFIVYQATPGDPVVLAGVILAMMLIGLTATSIPALRALRADPLVLLREE